MSTTKKEEIGEEYTSFLCYTFCPPYNYVTAEYSQLETYNIYEYLSSFEKRNEKFAIKQCGFSDLRLLYSVLVTENEFEIEFNRKIYIDTDLMQNKLIMERCRWWYKKLNHPLYQIVLNVMTGTIIPYPNDFITSSISRNSQSHVIVHSEIIWRAIHMLLSEFQHKGFTLAASEISPCKLCSPIWLPPPISTIQVMVRVWPKKTNFETPVEWFYDNKDKIPSYADVIWTPMLLRLTSSAVILKGYKKEWYIPLDRLSNIFVDRADPIVDFSITRNNNDFGLQFPKYKNSDYINLRAFDATEWSHDWKLTIIPSLNITKNLFQVNDIIAGDGDSCSYEDYTYKRNNDNNINPHGYIGMWDRKMSIEDMEYTYLGANGMESFTLTLGKVANKNSLHVNEIYADNKLIGGRKLLLPPPKHDDFFLENNDNDLTCLAPLTIRLTEEQALLWQSIIKMCRLDQAKVNICKYEALRTAELWQNSSWNISGKTRGVITHNNRSSIVTSNLEDPRVRQYMNIPLSRKIKHFTMKNMEIGEPLFFVKDENDNINNIENVINNNQFRDKKKKRNTTVQYSDENDSMFESIIETGMKSTTSCSFEISEGQTT